MNSDLDYLTTAPSIVGSPTLLTKMTTTVAFSRDGRHVVMIRSRENGGNNSITAINISTRAVIAVPVAIAEGSTIITAG